MLFTFLLTPAFLAVNRGKGGMEGGPAGNGNNGQDRIDKDYQMKINKLFLILMGYMPVVFFSLEAHSRKTSCCIEFSKAKDGQDGSSGAFEDGGHGEDGENGGNEGNGGTSIYGNGGKGGHGGDAD